MPSGQFRPGQFRPTRPALEALIASYNRWEGDINRMKPYPERAADASLKDYGEVYNLPPPPKSYLFIANLPTVAVRKMSADDQKCSICLNSFVTSDNVKDTLETPTRLRCGHIVGNRCLRMWLFPYGHGEHCPICRAKCLPNDRDMPPLALYHATDDMMEIRLDEVVWADHEGGRPLSEVERAKLQSSRSRILENRLAAALEELDSDFDEFDPKKSCKNTPEWRDTRARWERRKEAVEHLVSRIKRRDWRIDVRRMDR